MPLNHQAIAIPFKIKLEIKKTVKKKASIDERLKNT